MYFLSSLWPESHAVLSCLRHLLLLGPTCYYFSLHLAVDQVYCVWTVSIWCQWRWPFNHVSNTNHFLLQLPPWIFFLPPPLVLVAVHLKIFHFAFWSSLVLQSAQCALSHSTHAHEGSSAGILFFLNPGPPVHLCGSFCCSKSWLDVLDVFSSAFWQLSFRCLRIADLLVDGHLLALY